VNAAVRVAVAIAASVLGLFLFPVYLSLRAGENKIFEPQRFDFALIGMAAFLIALGLQVIPWRAAASVGILGVLVGAGLLVGILGVFSIGLFVLPVALVLLVLLARALRRDRLAVVRPAALGGAAVGYGAVLLYIGVIIPPTFECLADGRGSASSQRWDRGESMSISTTGLVSGRSQSGRIETPTSIATFRCEQGKILEFHREAR
jgi:hypothetical protein